MGIIEETLSRQLGWVAVPTSLNVELMIKLCNQGAYVGERLSFGLCRKGYEGNAGAANRIRENRPSGMRGGLRGNVV